MRSLCLARCCCILGVHWLHRGHFHTPSSNSVGKEPPLLWKAGHTVSSFLILAGGAERRGDSPDCETWSKTVNNVKVKLCSRELLSWRGYQSWFTGLSRERVEKFSILNLLTFELLRFLADLSAGLTGSVAAAVGEVRRGESCNCETWNKYES